MTELIKRNFVFHDNTIRLVNNKQPMFVAKDICNLLGLTNITQALKNIPEKWKSIEPIQTSSGIQDMLIINEPGLYKLVMRSNHTNSQEFQEWVYEEVLPSLRKTGEYKIQKELEEKNLQLETKETEIKQLKCLVKKKARKQYKKGHCVYIVKNPDIDDKLKIGSTMDMTTRLMIYHDSGPHDYELLHQRNIPVYKSVEATLLFIMDSARCETPFKGGKKREWLKLDSNTIKMEIDGLCDYIESRKIIYSPTYSSEPEEEKKVATYATKECIKCKETKSLKDFFDRPANKDGKENICRDCYIARQLLAKEKKKQERLKNNERKCTKCNIIRELIEYDKSVNFKDGYSPTCLKCNVIIDKTVDKSEKTCSKCKETKAMGEYHNCRTSWDGKFNYCKVCATIRNKMYKDSKKKKVVSPELLSNKVCNQCGEDKAIDSYKAHQQSLDGYYHKCTDCIQSNKRI
jgi:prophage antirepressor-like protein